MATAAAAAAAAVSGGKGECTSASAEAIAASASPGTIPCEPSVTKRFEGSIELSELSELSPTYVAVNGDPEEEGFSVRYFLRLVLVAADGKRFWNTAEVVLYRSVLSPAELVKVEV